MAAETYARRICIFMPSLEGGGAERGMVILANSFAARGREVTMVLAENGGQFLDDVDPSIEVNILGSRHTILSSFKLTAVLRGTNPNVVLSGLNQANVASVFACNRFPNIKAIVSEHNSVAQTLSRKGKMAGLIYRHLISRYYPKAECIVCVSNGVAEEFLEYPSLKNSHFRTIYNPIDVQEVRTRSLETPETKPHIHSQLPLIVACGRLHPQKGFDVLLRSFAELRKQTACNLMILGEGPEREDLERMVDKLGLTEHVQLPGFLKNPFSVMGRASVFVLSSNHEGLGNVLIEAMALGTPVVSTDCPHGPREILGGGRWGHLVPVGDTDALATAILDTLHAPPTEPEALRARADTFDKAYAIEAYLAVLDDAVKDAKQSR